MTNEVEQAENLAKAICILCAGKKLSLALYALDISKSWLNEEAAIPDVFQENASAHDQA